MHSKKLSIDETQAKDWGADCLVRVQLSFTFGTLWERQKTKAKGKKREVVGLRGEEFES
jgi:hypothetical protein